MIPFYLKPKITLDICLQREKRKKSLASKVERVTKLNHEHSVFLMCFVDDSPCIPGCSKLVEMTEILVSRSSSLALLIESFKLNFTPLQSHLLQIATFLICISFYCEIENQWKIDLMKISHKMCTEYYSRVTEWWILDYRKWGSFARMKESAE